MTPAIFQRVTFIALMYLMNVKLFPGSDSHPIAGYEKKSEPLRVFDDSDTSFKLMKNVLNEILYLHDWITFTAADFYNKGAQRLGQKGRGAGLSFMKQAGRKKFEATFLQPGPSFDTRLEDAALYPILAAFRVFLTPDPQKGTYKWIGGFNAVREAWEDLAYDLVKATLHTSNEVGRAKNAIGKSRLHWDGIYQKVENYKLRKLAAA